MVFFQDRPECQAAVSALIGRGVCKGAILECLQKLVDERGGPEAWTFIKAQDYQCVRKMLESKRAKKAELMDREEKTNDLSEGQLAEAEFLCAPLGVPVWYVHQTVRRIYQNYGAQPSAWVLLKEDNWEQVMTYILNDPNKPTSSAAPEDHGARTSGRAPPEEPVQRLPRSNVAEGAEHAGPAKDLEKDGVGVSSRHHNNQARLESTMSEAQRATVDEVEQKAAVLASSNSEQVPFFADRVPGSPNRGATKRVISSPPQPHSSASMFTSRELAQEPAISPVAIVAPLSKMTHRTQLLDLPNASPHRAALAKKSQEASEEAQRKRREEREHHAQLRLRAGSFHKRGQETVQRGAESPVTAHRDRLQADDLAQSTADADPSVSLSPAARPSVKGAGVSPRSQSGPGESTFEKEGSSSFAIGQGLRNQQRVGRSSGERPSGLRAVENEASVRGGSDRQTNGLDSRAQNGNEVLHIEARNLIERAELHRRPDRINGHLALPRHGLELERDRRQFSEQELDEDSGTIAASAEVSQSGTGEACPERREKRLHRLRKLKEKEVELEARQASGKRSRTLEARDGSSDAEAVSCGPWSGNEKHRGIRSMAAIVRTKEKRPIGSGQEDAAPLRDSSEGAAKGLEKRKNGQSEEAAKPPAAKRRALTPEQKVSDSLSKESEGRGMGREVRIVKADLANGWEAVKIPCVNAYSNEDLPDSFRYIKQNQAYDEARNYAPAPLVRLHDSCECGSEGHEKCLEDGSCSCTEGTGGVFAYGSEGRLSTDFLRRELMRRDNQEKVKCPGRGKCPKQKAKLEREARMNPDNVADCEGHVFVPFIKECSVRCPCPRSCINRVVQRGISARLQVFRTPDGKGWGLQCLDALPAGSFVCEYVGLIMTGNELFELNKHRERRGEKHTYPYNLDANYIVENLVDDDTGLCLDATDMGNVARFINHRCGDANLVEMPVEIDSADHNYYHCSFFTNRDVPALEELTWDYGIDFTDDKHTVKAFRCRCGSSLCGDLH